MFCPTCRTDRDVYQAAGYHRCRYCGKRIAAVTNDWRKLDDLQRRHYRAAKKPCQTKLSDYDGEQSTFSTYLTANIDKALGLRPTPTPPDPALALRRGVS